MHEHRYQHAAAAVAAAAATAAAAAVETSLLSSFTASNDRDESYKFTLSCERERMKNRWFPVIQICCTKLVTKQQ